MTIATISQSKRIKIANKILRNMKKDDLLQHLKERLEVEKKDKDYEKVAAAAKVSEDTVRRVLENYTSYMELNENQQKVVDKYLGLLNSRLREIERKKKRLIIK